MKMRIALVMTAGSSINVLLPQYLEFLASHGTVVDVYTSGDDECLNRIRKRTPGDVYRVPFERRPHLRRDIISLITLIRAFCKARYDIVLYGTPKALLLGAIGSWIAKCPVRVAWYHGRAYENYRGVKRWLYVLLDHAVISLSTNALFVSSSLLLAARRDGIRIGAKGVVLGRGSAIGVDTNIFLPTSAGKKRQAKDVYGIPSNHTVLGVIGRICRDKGILDCIEMMSRIKDIPNITWLFVGEPEDQHVYDALRDAQIRHNVVIERFNSNVSQMFSLIDIHVFPTLREGFGNVAIEAAAAGVPTIAYSTVGVTDSVRNGVTGNLIRKRDARLFEENLRYMIESSRNGITLFPNSRKYAILHFERTKVLQAHWAFLDQLTSHN